jgi:hypothetical protein
LPIRGQVGTFPIDHIRPRHRRGVTTLDNLAFACPRCNAAKWKRHRGTDPDTGRRVPLFNPRTDLWREHLAWSTDEIGRIEARTACGRATAEQLQMNAPDLVATRRLLSQLGLFDELLHSSSDA